MPRTRYTIAGNLPDRRPVWYRDVAPSKPATLWMLSPATATRFDDRVGALDVLKDVQMTAALDADVTNLHVWPVEDRA